MKLCKCTGLEALQTLLGHDTGLFYSVLNAFEQSANQEGISIAIRTTLFIVLKNVFFFSIKRY